MAKCKVLSKPDYELTLSSEEKEALQELIGEMNDDNIKQFAGDGNLKVVQGIWRELRKY